MRPSRPISRRSFLRTVIGAASGGAIAVPAAAQVRGYSGLIDSDSGPGADPICGGRRSSSTNFCSPTQMAGRAPAPRVQPAPLPSGQLTGITDTDNADPVNRGRGVGRRAGCTDSDGGYSADPVGRGRRC